MGREESTTEVTANDAVPGWAVVLVELLLDVLRDVLLHGVPIERLTERTREREKKSPNPNKKPVSMGPTGPGDENQIESRWEGRARGRACGSYHAGDFEGLLPHLLLHVGGLELDLVRRRRRGRRRGPRAHRLAVLGRGPERRLRAAPGPAPGLVGHSRRRGGAELPGTTTKDLAAAQAGRSVPRRAASTGKPRRNGLRSRRGGGGAAAGRRSLHGRAECSDEGRKIFWAGL